MLFGSAGPEVPPTVLAAAAEQSPADDLLLPLPQTPPSSDQEAVEVGELRKDVESLSQQLAAALSMLNMLTVSAAAATEAATQAAAAADAAAASAQRSAQRSAPAPAASLAAHAQLAPLNPISAPAATEAGSTQFNAAVAAAAAAIAAETAAQNAHNAQEIFQQNAQDTGSAQDRAAGSFAPLPAPAATEAEPLAPLPAPAAAEAEPEQNNRLFQYASNKMLRKFQLKETDPLLYSTDKKRLTPNCKALYGWGKAGMPEIFDRFERETARTGHSALQAIKDFKEEIGDCWTPSKYTMAGLTIVGLTQDKESPMAFQIEDLLTAADSRSSDIDGMILQVRRTGLFERVEGFPTFDAYDSSVIGSDVLWDKTVELIEAYFDGAADKQGDIRGAECALSELKQGDMTVQEYVSAFTILVRKLLRAGGSTTDQRMTHGGVHTAARSSCSKPGSDFTTASKHLSYSAQAVPVRYASDRDGCQ